MINRGLYALLLATVLGTVASQLSLTAPLEVSAVPSVTGARIEQRDDLAGFASRAAMGTHRDLFASLVPPPPPVPIVVPPPPPPPPEPPRAPPLPYEYLGLMEEDGEVSIFLKRGENSYVTRVGEQLDDTYQVTQLDERGVHLVYLPLKQAQVIPLPR